AHVPSRKSRLPKDFPRTFTRTPYVTRSEPTCWRKAPICALSRKCLVTSVFRPPNDTPSFPSNTCCTFTIRPIRGRSSISHLAFSTSHPPYERRDVLSRSDAIVDGLNAKCQVLSAVFPPQLFPHSHDSLFQL